MSERLGITQQTYARLEANPGSVSIERLFKVLTVLGVEVVLSSELRGLFSESSLTMEGAEKPIDSPT